MPVASTPTPNPNALKFSLGVPIGGPGTVVKGGTTDEAFAGELVALDGVTSVFFTADFVTISKTADASWDQITQEATAILESHFDI
jgi:Scaffold protein Nfu/NifU N terminal